MVDDSPFNSQFLIPLFPKDMDPLSVEDLLNRGGRRAFQRRLYPKHLFIESYVIPLILLPAYLKIRPARHLIN